MFSCSCWGKALQKAYGSFISNRIRLKVGLVVHCRLAASPPSTFFWCHWLPECTIFPCSCCSYQYIDIIIIVCIKSSSQWWPFRLFLVSCVNSCTKLVVVYLS